MKKYLYIFIALIIFPSISFASAMPKFPMAFYGSVTINGTKAPEGTVIKAYYGTALVGQSTVDSTGAYGYISSTAKKLLVSEGTGPITFKFQTSSILSGVESVGTTDVSYSGFVEGLTVNKDLAFTYTVVSSGGGGGGSSGGGGGGGGGNSSPIKTTPAILSPVTSVVPITLSILGCENRTSGYSTTSGQSCANNLVLNATSVATISTFSLPSTIPTTYNLGTKTLKNGSSGDAVKELQRFLNNTLKLGLVIDGKLGPKTINVVKQWQKNNGLVPDGLIGPKTKAIINK